MKTDTDVLKRTEQERADYALTIYSILFHRWYEITRAPLSPKEIKKKQREANILNNEIQIQMKNWQMSLGKIISEYFRKKFPTYKSFVEWIEREDRDQD
jgi:hypothetical protein